MEVGGEREEEREQKRGRRMRGEEKREEKGGRRMRKEVGGGGEGGEGREVMSHSDSEKDMSVSWSQTQTS